MQKLLFCKLTTTFDEKTAGQYYKVTKGAGNYDNVDKIEQNEKECWAFKEKSDKFVRGIPQGLPQSYFLGNIYMISIAEIFRKKFTGVSYFYVDDSVIFTNDVREDNFKEQLKELNKQIADEANNFEDDSAIYPEGTEKFYKSDLYGVNVHLDGKSNYTRLDNLDDSEVYLKCISREMSQAGSDFFRMYSDEENRNLEEKLDVLSKQVKAKRDQLVEEKSQKRDSGNEDAIEKDEDDTQKFEKRLTRYYRFFEYRKQRLVAMHQPENGSDEDYKKELEKIIYSELSEEDMEDDEKILQAFMNSYGADIWDANVVPDIEPHVIISSNVPESIYTLQKKFPKILVLYLMNKEKYEEIGAKNLYDAYRGMEAYTFGRKYSPTDILSDMSNDNPDILMKFLFLLNNVIGLYIDKNYGMVISICKKEIKYFDSSQFKIKKHADKKSIKNKFDKIIEIYEKDGCLIREVIESLFDNGFIPEKVKNDFEENIEYQKVLDIEMKEVSNLANYLSMPHISTQHGVKGESHTSVIFVASDNGNTPNVRMYPFFELWSELEFSLPQFEELFYSYKKIIEEVEKELGMKVSKLTAKTHNKNEKNKTILSKYSKQVLEKYQGNLLFEALCKEDFIAYLKKPNVKNVQKIFKITEIEGILTAYKLFYVGCSRARKNLIIMVEKNKIMNFKEKFVDKAKKIGFTVLS